MSNAKRQKDFLDANNYTPMYGIYQLKQGECLRDYRFIGFEMLQRAGKTVERDNYILVYAAQMESGKIDLEDIYTLLNMNHPADYTSPSLSVSDIIVYKYGDNQYSAFYVDLCGFVPLPDFMPTNN